MEGAAPETDADLIQRLDAVLEIRGLSQNKAAQQIGINAAAISGLRNGSYSGNRQAVRVKIEQWLATHERRAATTSLLPTAPSWFEGPAALQIKTALSLAHVTADIAVIFGGPGVGKTATCEHYRDTNRNVWIATIPRHCVTIISMLQQIADAVGCKEMPHAGARKLFREISARIANTAGLLILDEAQHLPIDCLDECRCLYDETKVGVAWVGDNKLDDKTRPSLAVPPQLSRRIGVRRGIKKAGKSDLKALVEAWGLADEESIRLLAEIAARPGALGVATKCIRLAAIDASGIDNITAEHIRGAWSNLGGGQ
ncbi:AAA family ATPase [Thalassobaculum litoreum]|uniref:AAA family ATPase n=1 Tax=Thalassobaculum litoreum TaxID=420996 RepID=UPI00158775AF|nr:AAA family ATPase [Thalassobaculum litoreum]